MSITLLAAAEPDWWGRGLGAAGFVVSVIGGIFTWRTYRRNGYKLKVRLDPYVEDRLMGEDTIFRRIGVAITVTNLRTGKVQIVRFRGQVKGHASVPIYVGGPDMFFTFDGSVREEWNTYGQEKIKIPAPDPKIEVPVRVGAELANGKTVWSPWTLAAAGESMWDVSDQA